MSALLVLADDLTGAIDTGVQFAAQCTNTAVYYKPRKDVFESMAEVLVINTQTRNIDPSLAYERVKKILLYAKECGITRVFKKTDSGMRGNVGAELQAVADVYDDAIAFAPAHPKMGRLVVEGALLIDGQPVTLSVFGRDPFKPVTKDRIDEIIAEQTPLSVICTGKQDTSESKPEGKNIWLFNASSLVEMEHAAQVSFHAGCTLYAGCAGFAEVLMPLFGLNKQQEPLPDVRFPMFVISGSVSDITFQQLQQALSDGWSRLTLSEIDLLTPNFAYQEEGKKWTAKFAAQIMSGNRVFAAAALDGNEVKKVQKLGSRKGMSLNSIREVISENMGTLCAQILLQVNNATPAIIGGDTLYTTLNALQTRHITPIIEISAGTVFSRILTPLGEWPLISKSGSFGESNAIEQMSGFLCHYQV